MQIMVTLSDGDSFFHGSMHEALDAREKLSDIVPANMVGIHEVGKDLSVWKFSLVFRTDEVLDWAMRIKDYAVALVALSR